MKIKLLVRSKKDVYCYIKKKKWRKLLKMKAK